MQPRDVKATGGRNFHQIPVASLIQAGAFAVFAAAGTFVVLTANDLCGRSGALAISTGFFLLALLVRVQAAKRGDTGRAQWIRTIVLCVLLVSFFLVVYLVVLR